MEQMQVGFHFSVVAELKTSEEAVLSKPFCILYFAIYSQQKPVVSMSFYHR